MSVPTSMRSWTVSGVGSPKDVLEMRSDVPTPGPPQGADIMVKVSHAALNPMDLVLMEMWNPLRKGAIPAADFAGSIVQTGPNVSDSSLRPGMTVCGMLSTPQILRGHGTLCEYLLIPESMVANKPEGVDSAAAVGAMGVAGQSSAILIRAAELNASSRVLVNGASGGVGSILVQVLHSQGCEVIGICSGSNDGLVKGLGASEVVDYTALESLYRHLAITYGNTPFDAIFDCMGDEMLYKRSPGYLKSDGKFLSITGGWLPFIKSKILPTILGGTPRRFVRVMNSPSGEGASEVAGWLEKGWIQEVPIDTVFAMEDVLKAFEKLATKRAKGKIVIRIGDET